jgi:1,4-dihydroxy-2-naphthoate octaprenyltransferase
MTAARSITPTRWQVWFLGARPKTLGAAFAPVLIGTAVTFPLASPVWWRAIAALVVAVALQVGVNYANDYSDGIRGTDDNRVGPLRITASGLASPRAVKRAALLAFSVAGVVGAALSLAVDWRLLGVGALSVLAAWGYTGGKNPYGYRGLGELVVLAFFGFVATCGSAYVQVERVPLAALFASLVVGLLACAILLVNNIRDIPTDTVHNKRTLAVRLGASRAIWLFRGCVIGSFIALCAIGTQSPLALVGLLAFPLAAVPLRLVRRDASPSQLIRALITVNRLEVLVALLATVGLAFS